MPARRGHVFYDTQRVGRLRADELGRLRFAYEPSWIETGFPISIALPLDEGEAEIDAHFYFENLLPEGRARTRVARQLGISEDDDAALLFALGRDCAGALTILPNDEEPASFEEPMTPLHEDELLEMVHRGGASIDISEPSRRFSLAGAQEKLAVILAESRIYLPSIGHPSSHILKFETLRWVCFTELMGNSLARRAGLPVCDTEFVEASTEPPTPYLLVARYDRRLNESRRIRLHQEDIAQALGYSSDRKYEHDGGPSLAQVSELLRGHAEDPIADVIHLRDWQLLNYLLGNFDAHAKNLALLFDPESGLPRLAPFYDLVCIEFHNRIGRTRFERTMAFAVGTRFDSERIRRSDWEDLARAMHISPRGLFERLTELADTLPTHTRQFRDELAAHHTDNSIYDRAIEVVTDRCRWVQNNVLTRRSR